MNVTPEIAAVLSRHGITPPPLHSPAPLPDVQPRAANRGSGACGSGRSTGWLEWDAAIADGPRGDVV